MPWRKTLFWIHLGSGLVTGAVVAIMSVTGILIAFEEEILDWMDRDVSRVASPDIRTKIPLADLGDRLARTHPDFAADSVHIFRDAKRAYAFYAGREGPVYVDPDGEGMRRTRTEVAHHLIHELEEWHRFLGMDGDRLPLGKLINGICNLAFLLLCLTGIVLWWPRRWKWKSLRPVLLVTPRFRGKARDFNWHNVTGFWFLIPLVVVSATAVPISFEWGHRIPFLLAGEQPPKSRNFGMMFVAPSAVPEPPPGASPIPLETAFEVVSKTWPEWEVIALPLSVPAVKNGEVNPLQVDVTLPDPMPSRAYLPVELDPYTGTVLRSMPFSDRSPGLRARVWIRFLHTGGAFGFIGKMIVTLVTAASLILVWTGFALSWRRFVK